jgi:hypothetical protein
MDKWQELRKHFVKQATELDGNDDCAIFALEVLDLMDSIEEKERVESKNNE